MRPIRKCSGTRRPSGSSCWSCLAAALPAKSSWRRGRTSLVGKRGRSALPFRCWSSPSLPLEWLRRSVARYLRLCRRRQWDAVASGVHLPTGPVRAHGPPFGIKNSPAEMQRSVDSAFGELYHTKTVRCYIDDIGISSHTLADHLATLRAVVERSAFACPVTDHKRVEALQKAPSPRNVAELRAALGAIGYLRRFVPDFGA
eukprot:Polyplicarium_translucidae@DN3185_c0_g1_i6.p2